MNKRNKIITTAYTALLILFPSSYISIFAVEGNANHCVLQHSISQIPIDGIGIKKLQSKDKQLLLKFLEERITYLQDKHREILDRYEYSLNHNVDNRAIIQEMATSGVKIDELLVMRKELQNQDGKLHKKLDVV